MNCREIARLFADNTYVAFKPDREGAEGLVEDVRTPVERMEELK